MAQTKKNPVHELTSCTFQSCCQIGSKFEFIHLLPAIGTQVWVPNLSKKLGQGAMMQHTKIKNSVYPLVLTTILEL